jgi:hypothetical protein
LLPIPGADSYTITVQRAVTVNQITETFSAVPVSPWITNSLSVSSDRLVFNGGGDFLVTPEVNSPLQISFELRQNNDLPKSFQVDYTVDNGVSFIPILTINHFQFDPNVVTPFTVDVSSLVDLAKVKFRFRRGDISTEIIYLDNLIVTRRDLVNVSPYINFNVNQVNSFNVTGLADFTDLGLQRRQIL